MLESLPSMEEYHLTLSFKIILSSIRREMNATSPPGIHISPGDPVQDFISSLSRQVESTENGSTDFN